MPSELEPAQGAQLEHVADVEAVSRGVEAGVDGQASGVESAEKIRVGDLVDQAAKGEVLREGRHPQTLPYASSLVFA